MTDQRASSRRFRERIRDDPERFAAWRAKESARKARLRRIPGWRRAHEPPRGVPSTARPLPAIGPLHCGHPLLEAAAAAIPAPAPGVARQFVNELDAQDARSEYVLAVLERRNPMAAAQAFLTRAGVWSHITVALDG
jgi:hypothetical protein